MTALECIGVFACIVGGLGLLAVATWTVCTVIEMIDGLETEKRRRMEVDDSLRVRVKELERKARS